MTREERLIAYVDGELDSAGRAAFEAEMAADPALAGEVERHRRLRERVFGAYAPVLEEPAPARLVAVASAANDRGRPRFGLPQWAAVAASLVVGVVAGHMAWPERGPLRAQDGMLVARGDLAEVLDGRLAAEPGPIRVGLTFESRDGRLCRTFQSEPDRLAGVACREDGGWAARMTTAWRQEQGPGYRTAGSDIPPEVLAAVDGLIAGETFDARAESAARDRGWRP